MREFLASQSVPNCSDGTDTYSCKMIEELLYRRLSAIHTTMGHARIARTSLVESLESVSSKELPKDERSESARIIVSCGRRKLTAPKVCTICYGDFDIETPEGTIEQAVRLPVCNHVFGSLCLRTWLEDSDKCPYCRQKLPSEPKWFLPVAKKLLAMITRPPHNSTDSSVFPSSETPL